MSAQKKIIRLPEGDSWIEISTLPDELKCTPEIFAQLLASEPAEPGTVMVFGKEVTVPRTQKAYGQPYYFSGLLHEAEPIEAQHPYLGRLVEHARQDSGHSDYDSMLLNWYLNGLKYLSDHSDDTRQLVPKSCIYSYSFGTTRDFVITSKKNKAKTTSGDKRKRDACNGNVNTSSSSNFRLVIPLTNNTLVKMCGDMQDYYKHGVPKRTRVTGPRINVTLRRFNKNKK